jgi:hypothetical protein
MQHGLYGTSLNSICCTCRTRPIHTTFCVSRPQPDCSEHQEHWSPLGTCATEARKHTAMKPTWLAAVLCALLCGNAMHAGELPPCVRCAVAAVHHAHSASKHRVVAIACFTIAGYGCHVHALPATFSVLPLLSQHHAVPPAPAQQLLQQLRPVQRQLKRLSQVQPAQLHNSMYVCNTLVCCTMLRICRYASVCQTVP